jgi:Zn finger protein HypA/HybF involved in hydrogenase expression
MTSESAKETSSKTGDTPQVEHGLRCAQCHIASDEIARGWRGLLTGDEYEPTTVAIYCPECADREFGPPQLRLQIDEE